MLKRIVRWVVLLPVALVGILLSVGNRAPVTLSLDPFSREAPALAFSLPLYIVVLGAMAIGVILGGVAVWWKQGNHRKRARQAEAELSVSRTETARLRQELAKNAPPATSPTGLPVVFDRTAA